MVARVNALIHVLDVELALMHAMHLAKADALETVKEPVKVVVAPNAQDVR